MLYVNFRVAGGKFTSELEICAVALSTYVALLLIIWGIRVRTVEAYSNCPVVVLLWSKYCNSDAPLTYPTTC